MEVYTAYVDGRIDADPTEKWYQGELGFFDHYVIPLARRLSECGVFGRTGREFLDCAVANRTEWKAKGAQMVAEYHEQCMREQRLDAR